MYRWTQRRAEAWATAIACGVCGVVLLAVVGLAHLIGRAL